MRPCRSSQRDLRHGLRLRGGVLGDALERAVSRSPRADVVAHRDRRPASDSLTRRTGPPVGEDVAGPRSTTHPLAVACASVRSAIFLLLRGCGSTEVGWPVPEADLDCPRGAGPGVSRAQAVALDRCRARSCRLRDPLGRSRRWSGLPASRCRSDLRSDLGSSRTLRAEWATTAREASWLRCCAAPPASGSRTRRSSTPQAVEVERTVVGRLSGERSCVTARSSVPMAAKKAW